MHACACAYICLCVYIEYYVFLIDAISHSFNIYIYIAVCWCALVWLCVKFEKLLSFLSSINVFRLGKQKSVRKYRTHLPIHEHHRFNSICRLLFLMFFHRRFVFLFSFCFFFCFSSSSFYALVCCCEYLCVNVHITSLYPIQKIQFINVRVLIYSIRCAYCTTVLFPSPSFSHSHPFFSLYTDKHMHTFTVFLSLYSCPCA